MKGLCPKDIANIVRLLLFKHHTKNIVRQYRAIYKFEGNMVWTKDNGFSYNYRKIPLYGVSVDIFKLKISISQDGIKCTARHIACRYGVDY